MSTNTIKSIIVDDKQSLVFSLPVCQRNSAFVRVHRAMQLHTSIMKLKKIVNEKSHIVYKIFI